MLGSSNHFCVEADFFEALDEFFCVGFLRIVANCDGVVLERNLDAAHAFFVAHVFDDFFLATLVHKVVEREHGSCLVGCEHCGRNENHDD